MAGNELARGNAAITERARGLYDNAQVELIKHTVGSACVNNAELAMFLEICARYELDPFSKQIWALRIQNRLQIVVSRDGLLALANRAPDFRGCQSDVVHGHDYFEKTLVGKEVVIDHRYRDADGKPTHGGKDGLLRGDIVGAWAIVSREGHRDTYFYAKRSEYDKSQNVWNTHKTAMMIKVAEAMALRKAFSVSGVVGEHEVQADPVTLTSAAEGPIQIDFGDDADLARDLAQAFEFLGYRRAKIRTMLRGCKTQEDRERLLAELKSAIDQQQDDAEVVEPADVAV